MKIPLIFKNYNPNTRSHFFGEQIFIYELIKNFVEEVESLDNLDGAVIFIRSNSNLTYIKQFNEEIAKLKWCLIIVTENENCNNFYKMIKHKNCKIWLQTPGAFDNADYYLPFGWPTNIESSYNKERKYDWFFSGQVTHSRRIKCVESLRGIKNGNLIETGGFGQGLAHSEYIENMRQSKIVPCPGGAIIPDTFRVYEALESGCVPVVDRHGGLVYYEGDYWNKVLGEVPFPVVTYWKNLPVIIKRILTDWPKKQLEVSKWWENYKLRVKEDFLIHIRSLESNL